VDVLLGEPGQVTVEHHAPDRTYPLAEVTVTADRAAPALVDQFNVLRTNADMVTERDRMTPYLDGEPDKTLAFVAEMNMDDDLGADTTVVYVCPMHPEVISEQPGRCPQCGMKLLSSQLVGQPATEHGGGEPAEHDAGHQHHGDEHSQEAARGIEWEDDMVEVNKMTTPANMRWLLIDRATGAENAAIQWRFRVGDQVKIRLVNEMDSDHPMHHPFHVHGAGRFLIMSRDGVVEPNLVWKDTVLVRTGETVDILLDVTNPGLWMAHCHIAEHHESGMMFSFQVDPAQEQAR
jgi:FtsP/CotA-like multicopper oxidase with cupredoxin domain